MRFSSCMLFLSFAVTACATAPVVVPTSDWQCVSEQARAKIDVTTAANLASARTDVQVAQKMVVDARAQLSHTVAVVHAAGTAKPVTDDAWGAVYADREQRKLDATARIAAANTTWLRAMVAWREQRLVAATTHIAVVQAENELARATYIDRHLLQGDTYETAPFRGQLATAQDSWFAATNRVTSTRAAVTNAIAELTSAKEEYAMLARNPPATVATRPGAELELASFSIDRDHGHGHFRTSRTNYLTLAK
jgi:hypothetical protein